MPTPSTNSRLIVKQLIPDSYRDRSIQRPGLPRQDLIVTRTGPPRGLRLSVVWMSAFVRVGSRLVAGRVRRLRMRCGEYRGPCARGRRRRTGILLGHPAARRVRIDRRTRPGVAAAARPRAGDAATDRRTGHRPPRADLRPRPSSRSAFGRDHAGHPRGCDPGGRGADPGRRTRAATVGVERAPCGDSAVRGARRATAVGAELSCRKR